MALRSITFLLHRTRHLNSIFHPLRHRSCSSSTQNLSGDTRPDDTKPDDTKPDDTRPDGTKPDDTKPDDTKPDDTKPDDTKPDDAEDPSNPIPTLFVAQSYRRVPNSPTLPLESVAVSHSVQAELHTCIRNQKLSAKDLRDHVHPLDLVRAPEGLRRKPAPQKGQPIVRPNLKYTDTEAVSYAALRLPATLAANIYVMAEIRRLLSHFIPATMLDYGTGPGVSVMAATRSFPASLSEKSPSCINNAFIVDKSQAMLNLSTNLLRTDPASQATQIRTALSLKNRHLLRADFDIVCASYSLNEVVRAAMSEPLQYTDADGESNVVNRDARVKIAEKILRQTVKALWARTSPGGIFVVVEDGTAAGFETISFVRDQVLNSTKKRTLENHGGSNEHAHSNGEHTSGEEINAKVIAPCLHSKICPLHDSISRHRICRFQQRLNRPLFSRNARPLPTGYEDEYFSFIVIQKVDTAIKREDEPAGWGRIIRPPLRKRKHVAIDVCTSDGLLERRVVSKRNGPEGQYSRARRSKWGDIWPEEPASSPQPLNF